MTTISLPNLDANPTFQCEWEELLASWEQLFETLVFVLCDETYDFPARVDVFGLVQPRHAEWLLAKMASLFQKAGRVLEVEAVGLVLTVLVCILGVPVPVEVLMVLLGWLPLAPHGQDGGGAVTVAVTGCQ